MPPKTFSLIFQEGTFPAQKKKQKKLFSYFAKWKFLVRSLKRILIFQEERLKPQLSKNYLYFFIFF